MKIYLNQTVWKAGLERIRKLFDEFPTIIASVSGGKDSTVIFNLALKVAKEKNRLPLRVFFIDQEAEWSYTIEQIKFLMYRKDVIPMWYQIPIKIENSATFGQIYHNCWGEGEDWLRKKDPIAKKENIYGVDAWKGAFTAISETEFPNEKVCFLAGVRAEESPSRLMGMTGALTYKDITWGKVLSKKFGHYTFYPIYDWSYTDVWKAINENQWKYNRIYDLQYKYGLSVGDMRVSNLHHETAVKSLFYLQEVDRGLYNKMTARMQGIDTAGKMGVMNFFPKKLPFMFRDWVEYRDYLINKLVVDDRLKHTIEYTRKHWDEVFKDDPENKDKAAKVIIKSIIVGDVEGTKLRNYRNAFVRYYEREWLNKPKGVRQ